MCILQEAADENDETVKVPSRKRRRDDDQLSSHEKVPGGGDGGDTSGDKTIVRIRAKIHVTAAGRPGVDAPCKAEGVRKGDGEELPLPSWHPLAEVRVCSKTLSAAVD